MARKVYKLSLEADLAVLGLDSPLPPYTLAGRLNQALGWNLVRSRRDAELAFPSKGTNSTFTIGEFDGEINEVQSQNVSFFQLFFKTLICTARLYASSPTAVPWGYCSLP